MNDHNTSQKSDLCKDTIKLAKFRGKKKSHKNTNRWHDGEFFMTGFDNTLSDGWPTLLPFSAGGEVVTSFHIFLLYEVYQASVKPHFKLPFAVALTCKVNMIKKEMPKDLQADTQPASEGSCTWYIHGREAPDFTLCLHNGVSSKTCPVCGSHGKFSVLITAPRIHTWMKVTLVQETEVKCNSAKLHNFQEKPSQINECFPGVPSCHLWCFKNSC